MNQITLHRKGNRKPWVFEKTVHGFIFESSIYHYNMKLHLHAGFRLTRSKKYVRLQIEEYIEPSKIHASHFKLGNVTITFGADNG
jgi:hypothetical protein